MEVNQVEFRNTDERGVFEQVTSGDWRQLNVLRTKRGHQRGGHYHKITREFFYVLQGKVKLEIKDVETGEYAEWEFREGMCFTVEPYESHLLTALTDSVMVVMLSKAYNPQDTDIYEHW